MTKYKIVLVPFPYDDLSATKLRPALCLTNPIGSLRHMVVAYISSKPPVADLDSDVKLDANHPDFGGTGLRSSSTIRLHHIITVKSSIILRELGKLPPSLANEAETKIKQLFD